MIFLLQPFYNNFNKRIIKSPKLYFFDTGLACSLLRINNHEQLYSHYLYGSLVENLIIADLFKQHFHIGKKPDIYFWRKSNGTEIDIIQVNTNNIFDLIKIKASSVIQNDLFKNIKHLPDSMINNRKKNVYTCQLHTTIHDVEIIPWTEFSTQ